MTDERVSRRAYLASAGAGIAMLAGCSSGGDGTATETDGATGTPTMTGTPTAVPESLSGTLTVATYSSWVEDDGAAGPWLKQTFEEQYPDVTVEYVTPDGEATHYIQRKQQGAPINADMYVGLNVDQLITADSNLDSQLFDTPQLSNAGRIKDGLRFDPQGRAIPYDTGYIAVVFDESEVPRPETFADLTEPEWKNGLLAQNAQTAATGRAFLLWTIKEFGPDGYLDYWRELQANGVTILDSWTESYSNAYMNGERPMVVSYSTDQVFANRYDYDMTRHQVAALNGQGYANPEGMARFADSDNPELAAVFMDFMLTAKAQGEIAVRNVQFPAIPESEAALTEEFQTYAKVPDEPVTFTYDELQGKVNGWVEDWAREIAQG